MKVLPACVHALQNCFESWQSCSDSTPLDKFLQRYFRKNAFLGSKDRKLIANALFGYYRWYGWVSVLDKPILFQLLCGYFLDENQETQSVRYWKEALDFPQESLEQAKQASVFPERQKALISYFLPNTKIENLFPQAVQGQLPKDFIFLQQRSPVWLRSDKQAAEQCRFFLEKQQISFIQSDILPYSFALQQNCNLQSFPLFQQGQLEVQDISSQFVGEIMDIKENEVIWDACCGSGGKSLHLADLSQDKAIIYASDIRETSLQNFRTRLSRHKFKSIKIFNVKEKIPRFKHTPSTILLDVPCSCTGTWRKSPDLKAKFIGIPVEILETQKKLLIQAASYLEENGFLFYVTCSFLSQENEEQIQLFLSKYPQFKLASFTNPITKEIEEGSCLLSPPLCNGNWLFIAKLQKKSC